MVSENKTLCEFFFAVITSKTSQTRSVALCHNSGAVFAKVHILEQGSLVAEMSPASTMPTHFWGELSFTVKMRSGKAHVLR